jgi:hypothetical protein
MKVDLTRIIGYPVSVLQPAVGERVLIVRHDFAWQDLREEEGQDVCYASGDCRRAWLYRKRLGF